MIKIANLIALKKVAAILLIGILFFNWYGYRVLTSYLQSRADRQLEARLDGNSYDESQLFLIKIPSTRLSYYNSSAQFERVDGQIEVRGVQYKYVKRRLYNDSLELLCIPNHSSMQLLTARNTFFQLVNDLQQHNGQGKKSAPGTSKNLSSVDYYVVNDLFVMSDDIFITPLPKFFPYAATLASCYSTTTEQPPDLS